MCIAHSETIRERGSGKLANRQAFSLVLDYGSGVEATSSEFCQKRTIPPPSTLDRRVGWRSPCERLPACVGYLLAPARRYLDNGAFLELPDHSSSCALR